MGLVKLAVINKSPLKDDVVLVRSATKRMKGKDPDDFLSLIESNKWAKKVQGKYKSMVRDIRKKKIRAILKSGRSIGAGVVGGIAIGAMGAKHFAKKHEVKK